MLDRQKIDFALAALHRCRLFSHLGDDRLPAVAGLMSSQRYAKRALIFQEGDPGEDLFLVKEGIVRITTESRDGEEAILGEVHPCETFGELGLIDGSPRSATASAATDVVTFRLPGASFRELLESDETFRDGVFLALASELRRATRHLGELHFLDLSGRLASCLAGLARDEAPGVDRDVRIERRYSQTELAAMIGGTRQSVNRSLAELNGQGLVRLDGRTIVVLDVPALETRGGW